MAKRRATGWQIEARPGQPVQVTIGLDGDEAHRLSLAPEDSAAFFEAGYALTRQPVRRARHRVGAVLSWHRWLAIVMTAAWAPFAFIQQHNQSVNYTFFMVLSAAWIAALLLTLGLSEYGDRRDQ